METRDHKDWCYMTGLNGNGSKNNPNKRDIVMAADLTYYSTKHPSNSTKLSEPILTCPNLTKEPRFLNDLKFVFSRIPFRSNSVSFLLGPFTRPHQDLGSSRLQGSSRPAFIQTRVHPDYKLEQNCLYE